VEIREADRDGSIKTEASRRKHQDGSMMSDLVRIGAAVLLISALLTPACHAQENFPKSDRQKAEEARKKADEKANDEAYKATIKRTGDTHRTVDPWGNLRGPAANGNK
jgi:hypothetical protein